VEQWSVVVVEGWWSSGVLWLLKAGGAGETGRGGSGETASGTAAARTTTAA